MLQRLVIKNYALIEELDISFSKGMTIITGETGAGKSILLGALSLLIGNRADSASLLKKDKKCIIEGSFGIENYQIKDFFDSNDLDYDAVTSIRREISPEGKSRAFINDTPVNLNILKDLGGRLIEIHSQHETLTLNESGFQMMVVDSFAKHEVLLKEYKQSYLRYTANLNLLASLKDQEAKAKADADYYNFLFKEIDDCKLVDGEQEAMEKELELLNNSEEIKSSLFKAYAALNGDENNLVNAISGVAGSLQNIAKVLPTSAELLSRIKSVQIELKDISNEIENLQSEVIFDPLRVEIINDRLDIIYRLEQKHRVNSVSELLLVHSDLQTKLNNINSLEEQIIKLESAILNDRQSLLKSASKIHDNRAASIPKIEKTIGNQLADLGMKHAVLKIELDALPEMQFRNNGTDAIRFLFSANKGIEYRELNKVASGGELSRLMLCIKSMIAKSTGLPTIIFDEIDTGISGEIAHKVGNILKEMSQERQVIAITHLPQMASKGEDHLFVYKETGKNSTTTRIRKLTNSERVEEIAKMLSGEQPTKAAIANAKELLNV
ncbi:MAG TPA: DNA repair protein RecN [Bacteroidia bacterium]|nr:DNA repair protein RecN [Bacteroidia bacterium]